VWFIALVAINAAFLTSAGIVKSPTWIPGMLAIAAVANVPVFLICMFLLQTKFRAEMQADSHYAKYLQERRKAQELTEKVQSKLEDVRLSDLTSGQPDSKKQVEAMRPFLEELRESVKKLQREGQREEKIDPQSLKALAQGELAAGRWVAAAHLLDRYSREVPDDFDAHFARGVAYANARDGRKTNLESLRAYNEAIAFLPEEIDPDMRARAFTYRGAMLKRLGRFAEALADFAIAKPLARRAYEVNDLAYNVASTYALANDRENLLRVIKELPPRSPVFGMIKARLDDYFSKFAQDRDFLAAIG
jgi:tetratricopeptide (TPR) repeat protein